MSKVGGGKVYLRQDRNVKTHAVIACSDTMEEHNLKSVNNGLNANIYSYLETSGGQSSNLYLKVVHFSNTSVN